MRRSCLAVDLLDLKVGWGSYLPSIELPLYIRSCLDLLRLAYIQLPISCIIYRTTDDEYKRSSRRPFDTLFKTKVCMTSLMLNSIKNNLSMFKKRAAITGRSLIYSCIILFSCVSLVIARERNSSPIKPCLLSVPLSSVELRFAVCCHVRHTKLCRVTQ